MIKLIDILFEMYPPYKANMVKKTRYKASDVWTNDPEVIEELITDTKIICDNCGWEWPIADGGDDLYICHKCGHDNNPDLEEGTCGYDTDVKTGKKLDTPGGLEEGKQVGIIYHYTTFDNGLKILQSNQLKSAEAADSTKTNPIFAISFTRDKRFHNNHNVGFDVSSFGQKPQVRFTVDGNKLSNKYKIQPYAQIGGSGRFEKQHGEFEAEERVILNKPFIIPPLPYLKSIDILVEYKTPHKDLSGEYDFDEEYDYRTFAPIRAEIIKFAQSKNLPINLIINKNGDPWPDKVKSTLIDKILNFFKKEVKSTDLKEADPKKGTGKKPKGSGRRLYTDEDPTDTVSIRFKTVQDIKNTLSKSSFKSKSHARQSQIINLIHQRVRAAYGKAKDPEVKTRLKRGLIYITAKKEASKEKTERLRNQKENLDPKTFKDKKTAIPYGS